MATAPETQKELRSFADSGASALKDVVVSDRPDREAGVQRAQPRGSDVDPNEQGRYGNLKQNLTIHWQVQER